MLKGIHPALSLDFWQWAQGQIEADELAVPPLLQDLRIFQGVELKKKKPSKCRTCTIISRFEKKCSLFR